MKTTSGPVQLLDEFLPEWHFREVHQRRLGTPPAQSLEVVEALRLRDVPFSSALLALRLAPASLARRRWPFQLDGRTTELFLALGFVELARSESELVFGSVGQYWRFREELEPLTDAAAFVEFSKPGFAKGAINLRAVDDHGATMLTTETRVWATDEHARRRFRPYWIPVRAFGGLMRRELLAAAARHARRL